MGNPTSRAVSLGLLEVVGFAAATVTADAMAKAAPIQLRRRQLSGDGLVAIVITGEVAAVAHAIEIGADIALHLGVLVARTVIGRPFPGVAETFAL